MNEHTKLPWKANTGSPGYCVDVMSNHHGVKPYDHLVCYCDPTYSNQENAQANAEFIVRACNSHYQLVEACEYVRRFLYETGMSEEWHPSVMRKLESALAQANENPQAS